MKRALIALPLFCAFAVPASAHADDAKDCPPGSWFCGETQPAPAESSDLQQLPDGEKKPAEARTPPPVVVYQPPPTVVVQPREAPPAYYYVPRVAPKKREWGVNLHVGGAMLGSRQHRDAGMILAGVGIRYRPVPVFALQVDFDFAHGRDYNAHLRNERALTVNGLFFLNPQHKTQVYLLAGFGWAGASATNDRTGGRDVEYEYGYFGGQAGAGLEFRLSKHVALNFDVIGFVRGRVDDNRRAYPEFTDENGNTTNASGGGLFRGGLTFYW